MRSTTVAELPLAVLSILCIIAASQFLPPALFVQPVPAASVKGEVDSIGLLQLVRDSYRSGPVVERVELSAALVQDAGAKPPHALRSVVTASLNAAGDKPSLKLELSDLVLHAQGNELTAINRLEQRTYAAIELKSLTLEGLAEHLPPVPLPQIAFAFGNDKAELFKGIGEIAWGAPTAAAAANFKIYSISGTHKSGTIDMKINGATWRLMQLSAQFTRAGARTQVTLDVTPVEPGVPANWVIDVANREKVTTLAQLRSRSGEVKAGQKIPNLTANTAGFEGWSVVDGFAENRRRIDAGERRADAMVLLLFRATDDRVKSEAVLKDSKAGQLAMDMVLKDLRRQRLDDPGVSSVLCEAIAVFELQKFERERPAALAKTWVENGADLPAKVLHWSLSANTTIDRISPNAGAVIAVILPDLSLAGIVPLDGRSADAAAISTDLLNIIRGAVQH